jgi:hypothetical protein
MGSEIKSLKIQPFIIVSLLFFTKFLDLITTTVSISHGYGYEANPVTAYLLNLGGYPLVILVSFLIMSGVAGVLIFGQNYLERHNASLAYRKFCKVFIILAIEINMIVVANNALIIYYGTYFR